MITLSVESLITLCSALFIVGAGVGIAVAMAHCHHPESKPPPLKDH